MAMAQAIITARPQGRAIGSHGETGHGLKVVVAVLLGVAADFQGGFLPLVFAAFLILIVGLPHGASDHLVAIGHRGLREVPVRLACFLLLYVTALIATLYVWQTYPGPALAGFLLLSAIHFAVDDVADGWRLPERIARGLMPVTLPALCHQDTLEHLFAALSSDTSGAALAGIASALAGPVVMLAALAGFLRIRQGHDQAAVELMLVAAALIVFSPLVSFALVFAFVHSRGQTRRRMGQLGIANMTKYLVVCLPTLLGAGVVFLALALVFSGEQAPALSSLFIGLASLTVPHMLVTPLFEHVPSRGAGDGKGA